MRITRFFRSIFVPILVLLIAIPLSAQTYRGGIGGTVTDATGAVVSHAKVTLTNSGTGATRETETTSAGTFVFQDLDVATYSLAVSASGFGETTLKNVSVNPGAVTPVEPKLSVTGATETVDVSADTTSTIQTLSSANNAVIGSKAVSEIPLNGRDFTQLIKLAPGVNGAGSVNGTRTNQNNYQLDGADSNDIWQNNTAANQGGVGPIAGVTIPVEAIDQFAVQSSGNADAGRNPGGTISLSVKTGTNNFHGSAYFYIRNEFFAARDFFQADNTRKQKTRNQQFGGSLGGPIMKDKLFFFVNYERQKYVIQLPSSNATEPGAAYVAKATQLLTRHGFSVNPLSVNLLNNLWMGGNAPGLAASPNNYVETHPRVGYSDNAIGNLNYIISPKQTLRLQAFVGTGRQVEPGGSTYWYFQAAPDITQNFSAAHNWSITDHFSNQLLAAVGVFNQTFNDNRHDFNMPALGLNTGVTNPSLFGAPTITIGSTFDSVGATQALGRKDYTGHITDAATWIHGKHQIRFGGEYRRNYMDLQYQANTRGTFSFPGTASANMTLAAGQTPYTSNSSNATSLASDVDITNNQAEILALADYLAGNFSSASFIAGNLRRDLYRTDLAFFISDQFKITQNLTLNYGVRHEYTGALSSTGPISVWRPGTSGADANGLVRVGNSGLPSLYNPGKLHFAPRVGFNYSPTDKLAIRGSWGLYFDAPPFNGFGDSAPGFTGATARGIQANPIAGLRNVSLTNVTQWQTNQAVFPANSSLSQFGLFSVDPNLKMAYAQNFGLTTEYQLSKRNVVTVAYAGSLGTHLYTMLDANQAAPWNTTQANVGTTVCNVASAVANGTCLQRRRPYYSTLPQVGAVVQVSSNAASNYHSLQTSLKSSNFHGITSQISWTYGHSLDNGSAFRSTGPIDSTNLRLDYGHSTFDVRHTINGYAVYEIPGSHVMPVLSKGWQVTGFMTYYTGTPFSITVGDTTGIGMAKDRVNYNGGKLKTGSSDVTLRSGTTTKIVQWWVPLSQTPFSAPAAGSHGNTARDQFRGPNFFTLDASLVKNTKIREGISLQLRAEMFNVLNHMNMANPTTTYNSANFGQVTAGRYSTAISSGAPFNVQFAGKLIF
ncbi:TonB-dependent receptor [Terriglobus tenax]|uniref:TonB-dependent receptor n=1 Tax=Terriglobus tenax TaxID=1111115 RepID=UPI0021E081C1|nr:TonB-dependent receptor [Terriglobus tenax]